MNTRIVLNETNIQQLPKMLKRALTDTVKAKCTQAIASMICVSVKRLETLRWMNYFELEVVADGLAYGGEVFHANEMIRLKEYVMNGILLRKTSVKH